MVERSMPCVYTPTYRLAAKSSDAGPSSSFAAHFIVESCLGEHYFNVKEFPDEQQTPNRRVGPVRVIADHRRGDL
jgi:hypothetical protein